MPDRAHPSPAAFNIMLPVLVSAALLAFALQWRPQMLSLLANSDGLLPADFVWGALRHPATWRSFQWPRIPSFAPDFMLYAPLQALFGWRIAQVGYAAASLAALTWLAGRIAADMDVPYRAHRTGTSALAFLAAAALMFLGEWAVTDTPWHLHLMAPVYHSGPFILSVAVLLLARRTDPVSLCLVVAAAALGTVSDRMFVGTCLLPLAAVAAIDHVAAQAGRTGSWRAPACAALGCALGVLADTLLFPGFLTRQADVKLSAPDALHHAGAFLADRSGWFVVLLNASLLLPLLRGGIRPEQRHWWTVGACASVLSTLLAAALWSDDTSQRYLAATLWWPLILWAPELFAMAGRLALPAAAGSVLVTVAALGTMMPQGGSVLSWHDDLAACIARTGRTRGLAGYWNARRVTVASDWRILAMQVRQSGGTMIWGSQADGYTSDPDAPERPPDFSFIVLADLDEAAIRTAYGAPDEVLHCPGSAVWLYNDPAQVRRGLAAASPGLMPRGQTVCVGPERLRRKGGALPAGPISVSADRVTSRPVTFGPNLDLYPGHWRVTLRYRLQTDRPGADAWLVNGQWGTLRLARSVLPPADAPGESTAEITLDRAIEAVEVPTYLAGIARLEIISACFVPER